MSTFVLAKGMLEKGDKTRQGACSKSVILFLIAPTSISTAQRQSDAGLSAVQFYTLLLKNAGVPKFASPTTKRGAQRRR